MWHCEWNSFEINIGHLQLRVIKSVIILGSSIMLINDCCSCIVPNILRSKLPRSSPHNIEMKEHYAGAYYFVSDLWHRRLWLRTVYYIPRKSLPSVSTLNQLMTLFNVKLLVITLGKNRRRPATSLMTRRMWPCGALCEVLWSTKMTFNILVDRWLMYSSLLPARHHTLNKCELMLGKSWVNIGSTLRTYLFKFISDLNTQI